MIYHRSHLLREPGFTPLNIRSYSWGGVRFMVRQADSYFHLKWPLNYSNQLTILNGVMWNSCPRRPSYTFLYLEWLVDGFWKRPRKQKHWKEPQTVQNVSPTFVWHILSIMFQAHFSHPTKKKQCQGCMRNGACWPAPIITFSHQKFQDLPFLKLTATALQNRPSQKETRKYSNLPFSVCSCLFPDHFGGPLNFCCKFGVDFHGWVHKGEHKAWRFQIEISHPKQNPLKHPETKIYYTPVN